MPVPAAERERLQLLLPLQRAEPREGPPARHRVRHQGAAGHDLDVRPRGRAPDGAYLVSVLRSIGYKARVEFVPHEGAPRPGAPTARRASGAGSPTTRRPTTSSSRSSAAPTRPTRRRTETPRDLRPAFGRAGRACAVARDDQPRRGGRRLAQHRPHADGRGAVGADESHALHRLRRPAGRQLQVLVAVGVERDDWRVPRPALGALSLVLASAVQRSECIAVERRAPALRRGSIVVLIRSESRR